MRIVDTAEHIRGVLPAELQNRVIIGELPSLKTEAIALIMYDGTGSIEYFGLTETSIFQPIMKCVSRSKRYVDGKEDMDTLQQVLHRYTDDSILSCFMVGAPMYLGKGPEQLHEFQVTFSLKIKE